MKDTAWLTLLCCTDLPVTGAATEGCFGKHYSLIFVTPKSLALHRHM